MFTFTFNKGLKDEAIFITKSLTEALNYTSWKCSFEALCIETGNFEYNVYLDNNCEFKYALHVRDGGNVVKSLDGIDLSDFECIYPIKNKTAYACTIKESGRTICNKVFSYLDDVLKDILAEITFNT